MTMSPAGTVSGEEVCGPGSSIQAAAVPVSGRCAGSRAGPLEVAQVSEVTDVEVPQFHLGLGPAGQPGRQGRGSVSPHRTGVPVCVCVCVCVCLMCVCGPRPSHHAWIPAPPTVIRAHNRPVSEGPQARVRVCRSVRVMCTASC